MDKSKPTYQLQEVKELISKGRFILTKNSRRDSHGLGFSQTEIGEIISKLTYRDFYKSTTEYYAHEVWQDVYKTEVRTISLYIKFKIASTGQLVVITSFKLQ